MAFEPRLQKGTTDDNHSSGDSITGTRDYTVDEQAARRIIAYSSLKAASAVLGTAGEVFYAKVEKAFYGIIAKGNSTIATTLS
jgi:hypothetical protein